MSDARQRETKTHGKEERHDKGQRERTTKIEGTAKAPTSAVHVDDAVHHVYLHGNDSFAVRLVVLHGKGVFVVRYPFVVRILPFSNFFIFVLFILLLMFISQLVLYFVDYLLVLLNTMCIYPCFFAIQTYSTSSSSPHILGFRSKPRFEELMC
jgi:magnesium-transporting ATPase (P-type)